MFHESFNQRVIDAYYPIQTAATTVFLNNLLNDPANQVDHIKQYVPVSPHPSRLTSGIRFSGSIILRIVYGYDVKSREDEYVALAEESMRQVVDAASPGRYLVDLLPFLKYIPRE